MLCQGSQWRFKTPLIIIACHAAIFPGILPGPRVFAHGRVHAWNDQVLIFDKGNSFLALKLVIQVPVPFAESLPTEAFKAMMMVTTLLIEAHHCVIICCIYRPHNLGLTWTIDIIDSHNIRLNIGFLQKILHNPGLGLSLSSLLGLSLQFLHTESVTPHNKHNCNQCNSGVDDSGHGETHKRCIWKILEDFGRSKAFQGWLRNACYAPCVSRWYNMKYEFLECFWI